jgi:hypothetical protein
MKNYREIVDWLVYRNCYINVSNKVYDHGIDNVWRNVRQNVENTVIQNGCNIVKYSSNLFKYNHLQQYKDNI